MEKLLFTISIPTYNRKELLERNLNHLEKINFDINKFEVIVVDDGSNDGTDNFISDFIKKSLLNIKYIKKENGGKFTALNIAINEAKGYFFINCDSDDYLDNDCLTNICEIWETIDLKNIAGIIGQNLNLNSKTNEIIGDLFPSDIQYSDPIEMRFIHKIKGDKFPCILSTVLKEFKFPDNDNTHFIPESYIFYGISTKYQFKYSNTIFKHSEYLADGITNSIQKYRLENAYGCYLVYEKYIMHYSPRKTLMGYTRNYINYVRFSFHSGQKKHQMQRAFDYFLFPAGYLAFLIDNFKIKINK
ncbi:glycosyltransferase family A protein [Flavobacterium granuli]|uniref:Glycosyltransferase involved in cell wall biosynthesis n=1 Tax=Flavobacterium granuli TaxID=280093 RepID=A0ABU1S794_9FLAO|nr:glycosyltransferase family A protein [Flavobacterium granuli]MDR6846140.1 glycosyltransferase involved in cell wall biosynthesis [Flavobacterium granuli]